MNNRYGERSVIFPCGDTLFHTTFPTLEKLEEVEGESRVTLLIVSPSYSEY
jgi:hypothetical protein